MKLPFKIVLINVGVTGLFSLLLKSIATTREEFFFAAGLTYLIISIITLIIGVVLLVKQDKRYAQGFLLSAGILMLLCIANCSNVKWH